MKNPLEKMKNIIGIKLIELESVGCVVDPDTCEVYPLYGSGAIDFGNAVSLYETSEGWFEALSETDINLLIKNGLYEILK